MTEQQRLRELLLNYFQMVREFYDKVNSPETFDRIQVIVPEDLVSRTSEPLSIRVARTEKQWIQRLLEAFTTINSLFSNLDRWRDWFLKLTKNLNLTDEDIYAFRKGPKSVLERLQSQKFDEGFVRLVVKNAASDFLENLSDTRNLLTELLQLRSFIELLESPELNTLETRLDRVSKVEHEEIVTQMQQTLAAVYNSPTYEDFLRNLADLLHMFGGWRLMLEIELPSLDNHKAMRESLAKARNRVKNISKLINAFRDFVEARNLADYYVRQAEFSIIRMMLTFEGNAEEWWRHFIEIQPRTIADIIPEPLDPHQLLIGVTHSLALLEDLDQRLLPQMPSIKTGIGELGKFLQSQTINKYSEIIRGRLDLWSEYGSQWVNHLTLLRKELHLILKSTK